jgi:hypothetical protein
MDLVVVQERRHLWVKYLVLEEAVVVRVELQHRAEDLDARL